MGEVLYVVDTLTRTQKEEPRAEPPTARSPRKYNYTADFLRVALFTLVVITHTHGTAPDVLGGTGILASLGHMTRYGFVAITVFVLFLGYYGKETSPITFWRRRFGQVVLPYLVWSVIYTVFLVWWDDSSPMPGFGDLARDSAYSVLSGEGRYHLYFLLISMQLYLLFPVLQWLVARTTGHHMALLAGALAMQMGMFLLFDWTGASDFLGRDVYLHMWKSVPMYALFAVLGALLAVHFHRIDAWLRSHVPVVVALALTGCGYGIISHHRDVEANLDLMRASSPWNPHFLPLFLGGLVLLYLVGMAWNDRRGSGNGVVGRIVSFGALRAFGVFAVHPMMIDVVYRIFPIDEMFLEIPRLGSAVLCVIVLAASLLVVEVALHTPLSKALVARPRKPLWQSKKATTEAAA